MENVSHLTPPICRPWEIEIYPYLYDHCIEGRAVFPAAEVLIALACAVKINFPQTGIDILTGADFPRFLVIPAKTKNLAVSVEMETDGENGIAVRLLSSVKSKTESISRTVEHARVRFAGHIGKQLPAHPFRDYSKLEGDGINVPAAAIYNDLVPFGKAYQNISGDLSVSREGALAYLSGGEMPADDDLLGSPFVFDAALHMACVWAQRFTGVVPFPVGFARRIIYQKTKKRVTYLGRIVPVVFTRKPFVFDAWIFDLRGTVCEVIEGIKMQDVTKGRIKPPDWIRET